MELKCALKKEFSQERGSISLLVIGLFLLTIASIMVVTDISSLAVAKRSLVQATEAAAQRGVHTLDKAKYYEGKGSTLNSIFRFVTKEKATIPIDCSAAPSEVMNELRIWSEDNSTMKRAELQQIQLIEFQCDGESIEIKTSAQANLPFRIPFSSIDSVRLYASAGTKNERDPGLFLFGVRIF